MKLRIAPLVLLLLLLTLISIEPNLAKIKITPSSDIFTGELDGAHFNDELEVNFAKTRRPYLQEKEIQVSSFSSVSSNEIYGPQTKTYERVVLEGSRITINCPHSRSHPSRDGAQYEPETGEPVKWFRNHVPLFLDRFDYANGDSASLPGTPSSPSLAGLHHPSAISAQWPAKRRPANAKEVANLDQQNWHIPLEHSSIESPLVLENRNGRLMPPNDDNDGVLAARKQANLVPDSFNLTKFESASSGNFGGQSNGQDEQMEKKLAWFINEQGDLIIEKASRYFAGRYTCLYGGRQSELLLDVFTAPDVARKSNELDDDDDDDTRGSGKLLAKSASRLARQVTVDGQSSGKFNAKLALESPSTLHLLAKGNGPIEGIKATFESNGISSAVLAPTKTLNNRHSDKQIEWLTREPETTTPEPTIHSLSNQNSTNGTQIKSAFSRRGEGGSGGGGQQKQQQQQQHFNKPPTHLAEVKLIKAEELRLIPGLLYTKQQFLCPIDNMKIDKFQDFWTSSICELGENGQQEDVNLQQQSDINECRKVATNLLHTFAHRLASCGSIWNLMRIVWFKDGELLEFDGSGIATASNTNVNIKLIDDFNYKAGNTFAACNPQASINGHSDDDDDDDGDGGADEKIDTDTEGCQNRKTCQTVYDRAEERGNDNEQTFTRVSSSISSKLLEIDGMRKESAGYYACSLRLSRDIRLDDISFCCRQNRSEDEEQEADTNNELQEEQEGEIEIFPIGAQFELKAEMALKSRIHLLESILVDLKRKSSINYSLRRLAKLSDWLEPIQTFSLNVIERSANSCDVWSTILEADGAYGRRKLADFRRLKRDLEHKSVQNENELTSVSNARLSSHQIGSSLAHHYASAWRPFAGSLSFSGSFGSSGSSEFDKPKNRPAATSSGRLSIGQPQKLNRARRWTNANGLNLIEKKETNKLAFNVNRPLGTKRPPANEERAEVLNGSGASGSENESGTGTGTGSRRRANGGQWLKLRSSKMLKLATKVPSSKSVEREEHNHRSKELDSSSSIRATSQLSGPQLQLQTIQSRKQPASYFSFNYSDFARPNRTDLKLATSANQASFIYANEAKLAPNKQSSKFHLEVSQIKPAESYRVSTESGQLKQRLRRSPSVEYETKWVPIVEFEESQGDRLEGRRSRNGRGRGDGNRSGIGDPTENEARMEVPLGASGSTKNQVRLTKRNRQRNQIITNGNSASFQRNENNFFKSIRGEVDETKDLITHRKHPQWNNIDLDSSLGPKSGPQLIDDSSFVAETDKKDSPKSSESQTLQVPLSASNGRLELDSKVPLGRQAELSSILANDKLKWQPARHKLNSSNFKLKSAFELSANKQTFNSNLDFYQNLNAPEADSSRKLRSDLDPYSPDINLNLNLDFAPDFYIHSQHYNESHPHLSQPGEVAKSANGVQLEPEVNFDANRETQFGPQEASNSGEQELSDEIQSTSSQLNESLLWAAGQYLYMHMRAVASSSIYGVQVDVEWSNERSNATNLDHLSRPDTSEPRMLASKLAPFATIDVISKQNLRLQCTAQAFGRLPEVRWFKRIHSIQDKFQQFILENGNNNSFAKQARYIGNDIYWPLTQIDFLYERLGILQHKQISFVSSQTTSIFDNLVNQTFTVVNNLLLSQYNDEEAAITTLADLSRAYESPNEANKKLMKPEGNMNLYACIVDADVRHNYATLGVHFRRTPNKMKRDLLGKRLLKAQSALIKSTNEDIIPSSNENDIRHNDNLIAREVSELNDEFASFDLFKTNHIEFPLYSHWVPVKNRSLPFGSMALGSLPLTPAMLSIIIVFVFSSLLALVYLTLRSYQSLTNFQLDDGLSDQDITIQATELQHHHQPELAKLTVNVETDGDNAGNFGLSSFTSCTCELEESSNHLNSFHLYEELFNQQEQSALASLLMHQQQPKNHPSSQIGFTIGPEFRQQFEAQALGLKHEDQMGACCSNLGAPIWPSTIHLEPEAPEAITITMVENPLEDTNIDNEDGAQRSLVYRDSNSMNESSCFNVGETCNNTTRLITCTRQGQNGTKL